MNLPRCGPATALPTKTSRPARAAELRRCVVWVVVAARLLMVADLAAEPPSTGTPAAAALVR